MYKFWTKKVILVRKVLNIKNSYAEFFQNEKYQKINFQNENNFHFEKKCFNIKIFKILERTGLSEKYIKIFIGTLFALYLNCKIKYILFQGGKNDW